MTPCVVRRADTYAAAGNGPDSGAPHEAQRDTGGALRKHRQSGFPDSAVRLVLLLHCVRRRIQLAPVARHAYLSRGKRHGQGCSAASRD